MGIGMINSCPRCSGTLFINQDKDLSCLMCGNILALRRKVYDTRNSKGRISKEKISRSNMDGVSEIPERRTLNRGTSYHRNAIVGERGLYRKR